MTPYWSAGHTSSTCFNSCVTFQEEFRVESKSVFLALRTNRDSIVSRTDWTFEESWFNSWRSLNIFFFHFQTARTDQGSTVCPNECISTAFSERVSGWGVKPTTYLHPLYWLRRCGAISPLSHTLNVRNRYTLQLLHCLLVHIHISINNILFFLWRFNYWSTYFLNTFNKRDVSPKFRYSPCLWMPIFKQHNIHSLRPRILPLCASISQRHSFNASRHQNKS